MASRDFFISYNRFDQQWAEWVAWILEEAGYSVVIQAWDFRPGGNFVLDMQRAAADSEKTIAILSETYLNSAYTQPEWAAAFADDPSAIERKLLPIRVKPCEPTGMLKPIVYVDLVGVPQAEAKQKVLDMVKERVKPDREPAFPGETEPAVPGVKASKVQFPGETIVAKNKMAEIKIRGLNQQIESLTQRYEALAKQLSVTGDEDEKLRIKDKMLLREEELTGLLEEREKLGV